MFYQLRWATKKILARDVLYLPRRLSYSIRKSAVDGFFSWVSSGVYAGLPEVPSDVVQCMDYFRSRKTPRFHFQGGDIEAICQLIPVEKRTETIRLAEEIVRNVFTFRGYEPVQLEPVDWACTHVPVSGWAWDLNRHFYFAKLGFAYWYTGDRRFADTFVSLVNDWIGRYGNRIGKIPWDTPFEVAARINAWIWAYFLFLPCPHWDPSAHRSFLIVLGRLAEYLYWSIEYHNPGNHLLLEAKSLALCGGLFPEYRGAERWQRKAWRILKREMGAQICGDGVHAERSTMYHRIVAGELAELLLFSTRNKGTFSESTDIVRRMAEFESWVSGGSPEGPLFGDAHSDDSYLRFSAPAIVRELCSSAEIKTPISNHDDHSDWALATLVTSSRIVSQPKTSANISAKGFPEGGYFVSRWENRKSAPSVLVWDCGPVGYSANPYHAHLDALSFTLSVDGVGMLVDPGIDESSVTANRRLRGTMAHNTVVVDGENQSMLAPLGSRNEVWSPAQCKLHTFATSPDCDIMVGSHNGYQRLAAPVTHTRSIISMHDKYWMVFDRLDGLGSHSVAQRFHIAPSASVGWTSGNNLELIRGEAALTIDFALHTKDGRKANMHSVTLEEDVAVITSHSPERIDVVNVREEGRLPIEMAAVLAPQACGIDTVHILHEEEDKNAGFRRIEINGDQFSDTICLTLAKGQINVPFDGWRTDAEILIVRRREHEITELYAVGATTLAQGSSELIPNDNPHSLLHVMLCPATLS